MERYAIYLFFVAKESIMLNLVDARGVMASLFENSKFDFIYNDYDSC